MNETSTTSRPDGSSLEISEAEIHQPASRITQLVTDYFAQFPNLKVFPETYGGKAAEKLGSSLPIEAEPLDQLLNDCRVILDGSRHNGHPRFFGYVASPATAPGAFADLIASALNSNVTSWRSGPAATEIERTVVRWLAALIGYGGRLYAII